MSQYDFGTIDPNLRDGTWLANALNNWRTALYSIHRGPTRPPYAVAGQMWISDAGGASAWRLKQYMGGTIDVDILIINTVTGTASLAMPVNIAANGGLVAASNLSDLPNKTTARTNLGLGALATAAQVNGSQIALASQAQGALMWLDGGVWKPLPAGVAGRVLTSTGSTQPTWNALPATPSPEFLNVSSGTEMGFAVGGPIVITMTTEGSDLQGWWNGSNTLTLPVGGVFFVTLQTLAGSYGTYGSITVAMTRNAGTVQVGAQAAGMQNDTTPITLNAIVEPGSGANTYYFSGQSSLAAMRLFGATLFVHRIR